MSLNLRKGLECVFLALVLFSYLCQTQATPKHHHRHRSSSCPSGWTEHDDSCYKHFSTAMSWSDAAANCARHDAHLVIINSDDEADWLCTRLSKLLLTRWNMCRAWWTAGRSSEGNWIWDQTQSVYEMIIRSNKWFGGRPNANNLDDYGVTMQLANGYFGLIARDLDTHLPSVCEKDVEESGSIDSDTSTGSRGRHSRGSSSSDSDRIHHSRGSESRGLHSRGSGSRDSDRSHGHGHHSRGSGSHGSHGHHHRGRGGHSRGRHNHGSRYGHIHGQSPQYRQNPYSPYYPRPRLPDNCEQPETTVAPTRPTTTERVTTTAKSTTTPCVTHPPTTYSTTLRPTTTEKPTTTEEPTTTTERPTTTKQPTTTTEATEQPTTAVTSTTDPDQCPPGWLSFSTSYYQVQSSCAQTRYIAETACELLGGHLVTINIPEEEEFLTSKLDKRKEWWISGRYEDGDWTFEDDSNESDSSSSGEDDYLLILSRNGRFNDEEYTNWHQNEPTEEEEGSCAVLSFSRGHWGWRSRDGHKYRNFICEVRKDKVPLGCLTNPCQLNVQGISESNDWERFIDKEYLVQDSCAKTQSDAAATCRSKGGELASIKSSAEMRFVERLLRTRSYDMEDAPNWWINGIKAQGKWQWHGSGKRLIYTNWGPDLDEILRGNFMILHYYSYYDEWMWTDTNQAQDLPFICQRAA